MKITLIDAGEPDVRTIAGLHTAVDDHLAQNFGLPPRKSPVSEKSVSFQLRQSRVLVARKSGIIIGVLQLTTKKPWAIDKSYFTPCARPIYLIGMAVRPAFQRKGVGRAMLTDAARIARDWPGNAVWLDAYDAPHGAGGFYAKCGYREVKRAPYKGTPLIYYELVL